MLAGVVEERHNTNGAAGAAVPLLVLNGHVCALSPEAANEEKNGRGRESVFKLRDPYAWESDGEATGLLMPRWMWSVVDGEMVRAYRIENHEKCGYRTIAIKDTSMMC